MRRAAVTLLLFVIALGRGKSQAPLPAVEPALEVTLQARSFQPGEVIRVDVQGPRDLRGVDVQAFGLTLPAAAVGGGAWRVLVGIDLDVVPGEHGLIVVATTPAGIRTEWRETMVVEDKVFPTRTLRVDPRFVTPPARERPRIEREAQRLAAVFAAGDMTPAWPGAFGLPIDGAVVSGFGVRSVYNGEPRAPHGGADFASPAGTPVHAPADGVVVLADELYFTGGTVLIDHGGGLYSLLAHLSTRAVTENARVARGDVVGRVGATGRATGPHLHWTVRLHRARVDPLSLVSATASVPAPGSP